MNLNKENIGLLIYVNEHNFSSSSIKNTDFHLRVWLDGGGHLWKKNKFGDVDREKKTFMKTYFSYMYSYYELRNNKKLTVINH